MRKRGCAGKPGWLPSQSSARSRMVKHGGERCRRRRILDDAGEACPADRAPGAASRSSAFRVRWRPARSATACIAPHGADEILGHHRGRRGIGGEIGEEARMLPMRHAGQDRRARNRRRSSPSARLLGRRGRDRAAISPGSTWRAPGGRAARRDSRRPIRRPAATISGIHRQSMLVPLQCRLPSDPDRCNASPVYLREIRQALEGVLERIGPAVRHRPVIGIVLADALLQPELQESFS